MLAAASSRVTKKGAGATPDASSARSAGAAPSSAVNPLWDLLATRAGPLQLKLAVGAPGDPFEREADAVADRVMRVPAPSVPAPPLLSLVPPTAQRACAACTGGAGAPSAATVKNEDEDEGEKVQAKESSAGTPSVSPRTESRIASMRGDGGRPLPAALRGYFEPRLGHDLSGVRLHTGGDAAETARSVGARAFTVGRDVAFGSGEYQPDSHQGRRLLAHELVHTLQQGAAGPRIQRTSYSDCTDDQLTSMVRPAMVDANHDLDAAMTALTPRPLTGAAKAALWLAFRRDDDATADAVKATLQKIKDGLASGTVECEQPDGWQFMCEKGRLGYTIMFGTFHICMNAWPTASAQLRSLNMIHEGGHAFGHMMGDNAYFSRAGCAETATTEGLSPARRLDTPDAYSCFVSYLRYESGIEARADQYRGLGLALSQVPAGAVDLNSTDEHTPLFQMTGVPSFSGFRFRWIIADPSDNRFLMRADTGDPFQFGPHPTAFIGAPTRTLLKQRGITSGQVICRADVPESGERLFTLDVTFTG